MKISQSQTFLPTSLVIFCPTIRKLKASLNSLEDCNLKLVYNFLMSDIIREQIQIDPNNELDSPLTPLKCETMSPTTDWNKTWRLVRTKGLGPELTSFMLKILWRITPTRSRLCRILPLAYQDPSCQLCGTPENRHLESLDHALFTCEANMGLPAQLLAALQRYQPGATLNTVLTLDLEVETILELPLVWTISSVLFSIWSQREKGRVDRVRTRAQVEASCRMLKDCKAKPWESASTVTAEILALIFNG